MRCEAIHETCVHRLCACTLPQVPTRPSRLQVPERPVPQPLHATAVCGGPAGPKGPRPTTHLHHAVRGLSARVLAPSCCMRHPLDPFFPATHTAHTQAPCVRWLPEPMAGAGARPTAPSRQRAPAAPSAGASAGRPPDIRVAGVFAGRWVSHGVVAWHWACWRHPSFIPLSLPLGPLRRDVAPV